MAGNSEGLGLGAVFQGLLTKPHGLGTAERIGWHRNVRPTGAGVLVVGLGQFGSSLALTMDSLGQEVLAVDRSSRIVAQWASRFPVVQADATDPEALEQLGAAEFGVGVVGIASSLESSVLVTANLVDLGIRQIWAKALSAKHAQILERMGANHIINPEADAGARVAHLVSGRMLDYIEVDSGFTIVKMMAPTEIIGKTLAESAVRQKYGVNVVGVKSPNQPFRFAVPDTIVSPYDVILVSGAPQYLEQFASRPLSDAGPNAAPEVRHPLHGLSPEPVVDTGKA
ncbi:MAG: TrkA family potassium uptake protein [Cellulomonadaceae bacterium]|jgi:trk system potassium uptake protein TrkA|nr:TrkA family potassium uptake protein [Cellulomonadaceae bacterium]